MAGIGRSLVHINLIRFRTKTEPEIVFAARTLTLFGKPDNEKTRKPLRSYDERA